MLNAAARLVSGTRKFDRDLSRLLHVDLHWLDVPERVQYKLGVTVRRCQQHKAQYLIDGFVYSADACNVAGVSCNVTGNTCNITRNTCNITRVCVRSPRPPNTQSPD